jgi:sphinganine-1-phosphate aldolase
MPLPAAGRPSPEILDELRQLQGGDVDWRSGRAFSLAYEAGDDVHEIGREAASMYLSTNALNPVAFPSLRRLQADVVGWVADLLHGGEEAAGFVTVGGTESILLTVKDARNRAREHGITEPQMVLPTTAHAAFTKASQYFGVEAVRVPVGEDFRADAGAMAAAVGDRTALVVASAPAYPQGVMDPVADIAALAADGGFNCHVDACMGGMTLPFLEELGRTVPPWDFRVPGVTSISVDLHKYGYAPKGIGVIVHRNRELRRHQTFVTDDWLGGFYASPGILGTRGGGPIAGAWAVMRHLGREGYVRLTADARAATEDLLSGLRATPGIGVLGEPDATHAAFTCTDVDAFALGEALFARGWFLDQQAPPRSLHATVSAVHRSVIPAFMDDLRACLDELRAAGEGEAEQTPYASID